MFGYVIPNQSVMTPEQQDRYRSAYCGLCRRIGALHGLRGRLTLSYDLTFLDLLLCSLYEGDTPALTGRTAARCIRSGGWTGAALVPRTTVLTLG